MSLSCFKGKTLCAVVWTFVGPPGYNIDDYYVCIDCIACGARKMFPLLGWYKTCGIMAYEC